MMIAAMRVVLSIVSIALLGGVDAASATVGFKNATSHVTTGLSPTGSACCFAVIDTMSEVYWNIYTTTTFYQVVNLTSLTTYATPYPNSTTHTSIKTNVYTVNGTFVRTKPIGRNPVSLYSNTAAGPTETWVSLNGSQTVTAGVTVKSPAAFWVYSTLRILTVPAVTDSKGHQACATTSAFPSVKTEVSETVRTIPYTDYYTIVTDVTLYKTYSSDLLQATKTEVETFTKTEPEFSVSFRDGATYTTTLTDVPTFTVNPNVESYYKSTKSFGSILSLATPFIYLPSRGADGGTGEKNFTCDQGPGAENYGYPMQELMDYAAKEHPEIASCLPGGPEVLSNTYCTAVSPATEDAGGDLTSSTVVVVTPAGVSPSPTPGQSEPGSEPGPGPTTNQPAPTSPGQGGAPPASSQPAVGSPPPNNNNPPPPPTSTPDSPATPPNNQPAPNSPTPNNPSNPQQPANPNNPTEPNNPANPQQPNPVVSAIVSIIGAAPIPATPGSSDYVVSVQATVPVVPGQPAPTGVTTVINGATEVIVTSARTIPASALSSLGGSTTIISGTLNVVFGTNGVTTSVPVNSQLPGLTGKTTVVGSSTYVILTGAETVPVVVGTSTAGPPSSTGASAPLQASGASRGVIGFGALAATFIAVALAL